MRITPLLRAWLLLTVLVATACTSTSTGEVLDDDLQLASSLRPFDGCGALTTHLRAEAAKLVTPYGLQGAAPFAEAAAEDGAVAESSAAPGAASADGGAAFSTTNVQEAGVDEADIVKTDGTHVYTVTDGILRVVDVRAARPRATAAVRLADGWPRDMLLHGDRLLVLGDGDGVALPRPEASSGPSDDVELLPGWLGQTRLWLVDVGDPSRPVVRSTMTVDGSLLTSRLTGVTARVVVRSQPWLAGLVTPGGGPGAQARALAANRARVLQAEAREWLPRAAVDGTTPRTLVDCSAVHAPATTGDLGMVSVLSLDLQADGLAPDRVQAVLGAADTVYASADSVYVTTSRWPRMMPVEPLPLPGAPGLPDGELPIEPLPLPGAPGSLDGELPIEPLPLPGAPGSLDGELPIEPVPMPDAPDLPDEELPVTPDAPTPDVAPSIAPEPTVTTEIHRFSLDDHSAAYAASGSVPGHVLNQWALSEHEGYLRIATTEDSTGGFGSASAVRVLRQSGDRLEQVGHVGDLGRGERIFAVRYAGDVGYVVTFRQIDPLYTLDLSDPTDPRVVGELKIPGYSAYLHPIGDDHLLGVGQDADRDGAVRGVQITMFDIADLANPDQVAQVRLGRDTSTDVEYDHRALLHWPARDLVVLPVQRWSSGDGGALVLTADPEGGLTERGFVRQPAGDQQPGVIQRSLVVDDRLVTVGPSGLMVSDLDSLAALGTVPFAGFQP